MLVFSHILRPAQLGGVYVPTDQRKGAVTLGQNCPKVQPLFLTRKEYNCLSNTDHSSMLCRWHGDGGKGMACPREFPRCAIPPQRQGVWSGQYEILTEIEPVDEIE